MTIFEKFIRLLLRFIFKERIYEALMDRIIKTKQVMTSNLSLKIFWNIVFFPIVLPFSLLAAVLKTIIIWTLGTGRYNSIKYALNMFFTDIMKKKLDFHTAIKRMILFHELVTKGKEQKTSYGEENPDKIFYVIRPYYFSERNELIPNKTHLLYNYYRNLHYIAYALDKGWIPIIDWENCDRLPHQEEYPINGTRNSWEYYWNQPSEYTLDEVYKSKNVVLSTQNTIDTIFMPPCYYARPFQETLEMCALKCPKYDQLISFNEYTANYIEEQYKLLFPKNARILGVSVRGTAYGAGELMNHPIQPKLIELISSIKKFMREWVMEYVYFACEAEAIVDKIKEEFGEKALILPRMRYKEEPTDDNNPLYVAGQRYQSNLDYVTETALLSRCDSLLASFSGGVRVAVVWNANRYEYMKIIDYGVG